MSTLPTKISRLRGDTSYSRIAEQVGCSEGALRQLEAGITADPRSSLIKGLASVFGVSVDWLLDDTKSLDDPRGPDDSVRQVVERALTQAGLLGELDTEERELLSRFRALPPHGRDRVFAYLDGLAAGLSAVEGANDRADGLEANLRSALSDRPGPGDRSGRAARERSPHR